MTENEKRNRWQLIFCSLCKNLSFKSQTIRLPQLFYHSLFSFYHRISLYSGVHHCRKERVVNICSELARQIRWNRQESLASLSIWCLHPRKRIDLRSTSVPLLTTSLGSLSLSLFISSKILDLLQGFSVSRSNSFLFFILSFCFPPSFACIMSSQKRRLPVLSQSEFCLESQAEKEIEELQFSCWDSPSFPLFASN
jgi:hypothetical protein